MVDFQHKFTRVAQCVGFALTVLVLVVDLASLKWYGRVWTPWGQLVVAERGLLALFWGLPPPNGWFIDHQKVDGGRPFVWWFRLDQNPTAVWVPLWLIGAVLALPTAWLWYKDRRDKGPDHCQQCGYDLTGLARASTCPECGKGSPIAGPGQEKA